MIPRLHIEFPLREKFRYWFGTAYEPLEREFLLNHARTGIMLALRAALPHGGRVGVVAYNCHTVANVVMQSGCQPVFLDVTEDLHLQTAGLEQKQLDAIVVTNLFGIRNDIFEIRNACPGAVIIVDNAHGYGLPLEGDFTVYSIGQGKFPSVGNGGILKVNNSEYADAISAQYAQLPSEGLFTQIKLFASMLAKGLLYSPLLYGWLTKRLKSKRSNAADKGEIVLRKMPIGIRRMYATARQQIPALIEQQRKNAQYIADNVVPKNVVRYWYGENAFMLVLECRDVELQKRWFAERGIETETHFKNAIRWATEFGYQSSECPTAEKMCGQLLMVPTYKTIILKK